MKGSPFTQLCRQWTILRSRRGADLHTHTTFSDGTYTPASLVERAIAAGLPAIAITDHDTTAAIEPARAVAAGRIEVIAGVEITAEFRGRELHLLGYFIEPDDVLDAALGELRAARRTRLLEMARRLRTLGVSLEDEVAALPDEVSLGRRHLAALLIRHGHARSLHNAFTRWLAHPDVAQRAKTATTRRGSDRIRSPRRRSRELGTSADRCRSIDAAGIERRGFAGNGVRLPLAESEAGNAIAGVGRCQRPRHHGRQR